MPRNEVSFWSAAWICVVAMLAGVAVIAQVETIPQAMARGATRRFSSAPSGKAPTMSELVRKADLVVRGTVGTPTAYLSDDNMDVYSDYPLIDAVVLHGFTPPSSRPGPQMIVVTQLGGTIVQGNLKFTQIEDGLPALKPGSEGVFVLKQVGTKYHLVGTFFGAFGISNGILTPLTNRRDFATEYRGVPAAAAIQEIVRQARNK